MWNNGFSEKRPELAIIFANLNYEWTPRITLHFPRASDLVFVFLLSLVLEEGACHRRIDYCCRLVIPIPFMRGESCG